MLLVTNSARRGADAVDSHLLPGASSTLTSVTAIPLGVGINPPPCMLALPGRHRGGRVGQIGAKWLALNRRLTLRSSDEVPRAGRKSGVAVDPDRVRSARIVAGLSLAQVAGDDVSRTFIHLVEHGRSRPSRAVLALIARRTGRPISYFLRSAEQRGASDRQLAQELTEMAARIRRFAASRRLTRLERQSMKDVEHSLHQGAALARTLETRIR